MFIACTHQSRIKLRRSGMFFVYDMTLLRSLILDWGR